MKIIKKAFVLVLGLFLMACGSEEKKKKEDPKQTEIKNDAEKETAKQYPKVEKQYPIDMNIIYSKGYLFDEKIQLAEIAVVPFEDDSYDLVLFFNDKTTDFEMLEKYRIGVVLYPKDPSKLENEEERAAKKKKTGQVIKVNDLEGEHVVIIDNIKVKPKEFKQVRLYLYNAEGVVLNENFLKIANVVFP